MARTFVRQDTQIRNSDSYDDTVAPTLANYETNPTNIQDDLNNIRSMLSYLKDKQVGEWYDTLTVPSTLETGTARGVDDVNDALHAVEKKRILRSVSNLIDISPGLDLAITLVNELKTDYEAHRVLTAGPVHGAADTTNVVSAADATDLSSAITLANEIKVDYDAHRILTAGSVHGAADTTNDVTAADATNLSSLITLVNDIRTQYEAHRVLTAGGVHTNADNTNVVSAASIPSTVQVHILTAAQLPAQTTAAVGSVTTLGTVVAQATTFGTSGLDEVSGATAISPKNLIELVDGDTRDPILDAGGDRIYGLLQTESGSDGHTMTGSASTRAQISFVVINAAGDDLQLQGFDTTKELNYSSVERVRLEDLNEQDFLRGACTDVPSTATVTRQVAYDNQGTTPVNLTNNAILDLEGAGVTWTVRDDLEANLLQIIEGSSGGTTEIAISSNVDLYDNDAVDVDFASGISARSGGSRPIDIGINDGLVETTAGDLELKAAAELILNDNNLVSEATWAGPGVKLSDTTTEVTTYESNFGGEVSLFNPINQAYEHGARNTKVYANVTSTTVADTDVGGVAGGANLDAQLPNMSGGTFITDYDVFLNGALLRPGADAAANNDYYPGTSLPNGQLKFEFAVKINDVLCVIPYA
jgi:hypothetical protein